MSGPPVPGIGTSGHIVGVSAGNGDGTLQYPRQTFVGEEPFSVALGDFNMDGALDIVTANAISNSISILIRDSVGTARPSNIK